MRKFLSLITVAALVSSCATTSSNQTALHNAYIQGYKKGIQEEQAKLTHSDIVKKKVASKIVGGVYIPEHTEYVIERRIAHSASSSASPAHLHRSAPPTAEQSAPQPSLKGAEKQKEQTAKVVKAETIEESVNTVKPTPAPDPNKQAKLFELLVNNYNFDEADVLYRNVITYIDASKIKDKYSYFMALGKYLMVRHDYKNAYDSYQKAYLTAKDSSKQLAALTESVTAAKLTGDKDLEFTALLNLGDFKINKKDKLGALECYYKALKIKSTPSVNLRIANILQGMGKDELAKAFALKAYILNRR